MVAICIKYCYVLLINLYYIPDPPFLLHAILETALTHLRNNNNDHSVNYLRQGSMTKFRIYWMWIETPKNHTQIDVFNSWTMICSVESCVVFLSLITFICVLNLAILLRPFGCIAPKDSSVPDEGYSRKQVVICFLGVDILLFQ